MINWSAVSNEVMCRSMHSKDLNGDELGGLAVMDDLGRTHSSFFARCSRVVVEGVRDAFDVTDLLLALVV